MREVFRSISSGTDDTTTRTFWTPVCAEPLNHVSHKDAKTQSFFILSVTFFAHSGHPSCIVPSVYCFPAVPLGHWIFRVGYWIFFQPSVHSVYCLLTFYTFWTPVLHGVFASPWRVALCRNRFPIPVMTEHNPIAIKLSRYELISTPNIQHSISNR